MARLIQITVDEEDLIAQYNWLCYSEATLKPAPGVLLYRKAAKSDHPTIVGLQNLLEGLMQGLWGNVLIYDNGHDRYLVIMPGRNETYYMSHDADVPSGICDEGGTEGDLTFTQLDNGDMVPVGFEEEVSIISVPKGVRRQVLKLIEDDLEYYEDHLVIT